MTKYYAYCYKGGEIGITALKSSVPEGTLIFAEGVGKAFLDKIEVKARHSKDGKTLLCPGLPEQSFQNFLIWHEWAFPAQTKYRSELREQIIKENHGTDDWRGEIAA